MVLWLRTHVRRRHVVAAAVLAVALYAAALAIDEWRTEVLWTGLIEQLDAVESMPDSGATVDAGWSFEFRGQDYVVTVPIDQAQLDATRLIDTRRVFGTEKWMRAGYIANLVRLQSESEVVVELAEEFRRIRDELALDDDGYLELMAHAVQSIPYGEVKSEILLPMQVVADGEGVCSEKSILLASLMLHEDYETIVWVFTTQGHAAVGVASDAAHFRGTEYAFVETTKYAFIGQASGRYEMQGPIAEPPEMVRVGGTKAYTKGWQVEFILEQLDDAHLLEVVWNDYPMHARLSRDVHQPRYAARAEDFYDASDLTTFIMSHTDERAVVYAQVKKLALTAAALGD